ncbi:hypothetical protein [Albibacterium bauzanense]|uniref:BlaR1 peptidase M56 n=1 Tax=Albibacterium bauzanense TaxID=653929 RepID=A0A4V2PYA7_9SPHI|nr:hypothetical protein [Albibacterium bauzanense]TCK85311.1 hypothetical protein C8N28_0616 [Albibacterium bauzanense]
MKIVKINFLPKKVTAMAIFPFVLAKGKVGEIIMNHERIHLRQQVEMLILPFYLFYVIEYIGRLIQYKNMDKAYRNISFEREAYMNEQDFDYLKKRKFYAWVRYLKGSFK